MPTKREIETFSIFLLEYYGNYLAIFVDMAFNAARESKNVFFSLNIEKQMRDTSPAIWLLHLINIINHNSGRMKRWGRARNVASHLKAFGIRFLAEKIEESRGGARNREPNGRNKIIKCRNDEGKPSPKTVRPTCRMLHFDFRLRYYTSIMIKHTSTDNNMNRNQQLPSNWSIHENW